MVTCGTGCDIPHASLRNQHASVLKVICHSSAHLCKWSILLCMSWMSLSLPAVYHQQIYCWIWSCRAITAFKTEFMKIRKRRGPMTDHWASYFLPSGLRSLSNQFLFPIDMLYPSQGCTIKSMCLYLSQKSVVECLLQGKVYYIDWIAFIYYLCDDIEMF